MNSSIANKNYYLVFICMILFFQFTSEKSSNHKYFVNSVLWQVHQESNGSAEGLVLLTIDDSPRKGTTMGFLDLLDEYNVKALFFVNGYISVYQPHLIEEILERGHQIGNHAWNHKKLNKLDRGDIIKEIVMLNSWLDYHFNYKPNYFRPPYGISTSISDSLIHSLGMNNMGWSISSYDWKYPDDEIKDDDHKKIARRTINGMVDGGIILLHDRTVSLKALEIILEETFINGYKFIDPIRLSN